MCGRRLRQVLEELEAADQKARSGKAAKDELERFIGQTRKHVDANTEFGNIEKVPCEVFPL